mgnify:CR=1 FL=1
MSKRKILLMVLNFLTMMGNLVSNTIIVGIGFTVSPKMALVALVFLVVIHKLEYFLNSKIIGDRIKNPMWLTLLGLILGLLLISQFWTLANDVYDPRQAKRIFGFIGGGASLGDGRNRAAQLLAAITAQAGEQIGLGAVCLRSRPVELEIVRGVRLAVVGDGDGQVAGRGGDGHALGRAVVGRREVAELDRGRRGVDRAGPPRCRPATSPLALLEDVHLG